MLLDISTVNDVFARVAARGAQRAMLWQDATGVWQPISAADVYARTRALAAALEARGVGRGDRVALISENRWEWSVSDFAVLALGAVDVPLYPTLTAEHIGYMLRDCGAKVAVVSTADQYRKVRDAGPLPELEHVLVMDPCECAGAESFVAVMAHAEGLQEPDAAFQAQLRSVRPDDLATIIYTSGTTGEPKGVMLTHGNLATNVAVSTTPLGFHKEDVCISFLPLSHVTARHTDYALLAQEVTLAYLPKFEGLPLAMQAVKPTIFLAVPRVYEKVRHGVIAKSSASPIKARILRWALGIGAKYRDEVLRGRTPRSLAWKVADRLVYGKIAQAFGGRVRTFISGGAPLGMDSARWFADVGVRILEGYGLTETSPVISVNYPQAHRIGTVGRPLNNVECRFASDGELEVRGPSVFHGYWKKPEATAEAFTPDGWFKTGDIGGIDDDGFLSITDRKKELLKTSGGKFVAPQPIENRLKTSAFVAHAALVGDRHKFICVLISPNLATLDAWAKAEGLSAADRRALVREPRVQALFQTVVDGVNAGLAPYESMKRMTVVPEEWSIEDGLLTPSMKLKRRAVEQRYHAAISAFYDDEATSSREVLVKPPLVGKEH
jgi:long-chain acyl-CoA synthetase